MGLLDNTTQRDYYQGSDHGSYQFVSLEDIINQFIFAYVGSEKIINKIDRVDVAFFAQRALAELSFDTFKSVKSQEITLPSNLTMILPHDYVNYTKLSWSDSSGVKHPLYPTNDTSNPFSINQNSDNSYDFTMPSSIIVTNGDFASGTTIGTSGTDWLRTTIATTPTGEDISVSSGALEFTQGGTALNGVITSRAYAVWQKIIVTGVDLIDISATGTSAASGTNKGSGTVRVGISTFPAETDPTIFGSLVNTTNPNKPNNPSINHTDTPFNFLTTGNQASLVTFNDGLGTSSTKTLSNIDVSSAPVDANGDNYVYVLITSFIENITATGTTSKNIVDDITITYDGVVESLQQTSDSTTWTNYKSQKPSENSNNDDYEDDVYWPNRGERYGLEPGHAQVNGSFYIDELRGKINFSSNVSGKTVILEYISDSLGTDGEMQVHKFAEDAMYKFITHSILSTRANIPEYLVRRYQKEKFAAVRKAKLRLSNIKLEEITQVLRGRSKWIKH